MRAHFVLGLALVVACSTFTEAPTESTNEPDGGDDAGTVDATPADDGGAIPPARPCGQVLLCDDFERDMPSDSRWSDKQEANGALTISPAFSKSPTRSLEVKLPAGAGLGTQAFLGKSMPAGTRRLTARLWVRGEAMPATATIVFVDVVTERGHVLLTFQGEKVVLIAQDTSGANRAGQKDSLFPAHQPHELVLDYRSALEDKVRLVIDANPELEIEIPMMSGGGKVLSFQMGATLASESAGGAVYYFDDVILDTGLF